ncbi:MAG: response regulator, partial [Planctomycetota bacterium]
ALAVERSFARELPDVQLERAVDGVEALRILRGFQEEEAARNCLVLIDLNMPRMGGVELLRAIRGDEKLRATVAFVHTTSKDERDVAMVYRLNVAGYLVKSIDGDSSRAVSALIREYFRNVCFPPPKAG